MIQLGANRSQTGFNIAQALPGDQLSEGHGEELLPAEKLLGVPVAIVVSRSHLRVPEIHRRMAQDPVFRRQIRPFCARIPAPQNVVNFVVSLFQNRS